MIGGNGDLFLIFTKEMGGRYHIRRTTLPKYEAAKESGIFDDTPPDQDGGEKDLVEMKFIALLRVEDNFDFPGGCSRSAESEESLTAV